MAEHATEEWTPWMCRLPSHVLQSAGAAVTDQPETACTCTAETAVAATLHAATQKPLGSASGANQKEYTDFA